MKPSPNILKTFRDFPFKDQIKRNLIQNSHNLRLYKESIPPLDFTAISIIRGGLLGDSTGIRRSNSVTDSLKIEQRLDRKDYVDHLYNVLYDYIGTPPTVRNITGGGAADRQSYWFRTYGHNSLTQIITPFYQFNPVFNKLFKTVPTDIDKWFNECVLAYWFMDDGSKSSGTYFLNTQSFTLEDNLKLQQSLSLLKIQTLITKDKVSKGITLYKLQIDHISDSTFRNLIEPFILPTFFYKL